MFQTQSTTVAASPRSKAEREAETRTRVVLWTMLASVLSVVVGQWWLSPWLCAAPLVHASYRRGKVAEGPILRSLTWRWAAALVVTTLIASVFVLDRVSASAVMGTSTAGAAGAWLAGDAGPVWGPAWLLIATVTFGAATVAGAGALGAVVLAALLTNAAVSASVIYSSGTNLFSATMIALSPWQWALFAGLVVAVPPLVSLSLGRLYRRFSVSYDPVTVRRDLIRAGVLVALAIVLRLALSGVYTAVASRWTLH